MTYVVDRYDGIDRISSFSLEVLKDDEAVFRYVAEKEDNGGWKLRASEAGSGR